MRKTINTQRVKDNMRAITIDKKSVVSVKDVTISNKKPKKYWFQFWRKRDDRIPLKLRKEDYRRLKKNPEESFCITMLFANGTSKTFILVVTGATFSMKKKEYYLYYEESWYDLTLDLYHLYYMENYPVPINREIEQRGDEAYFNVTPENLKNLIEFKYAEFLVKSDLINKILKALIIIGAVNIVITLIGIFFKMKGAT